MQKFIFVVEMSRIPKVPSSAGGHYAYTDFAISFHFNEQYVFNYSSFLSFMQIL